MSFEIVLFLAPLLDAVWRPKNKVLLFASAKCRFDFGDLLLEELLERVTPRTRHLPGTKHKGKSQRPIDYNHTWPYRNLKIETVTNVCNTLNSRHIFVA